MLAKKIESVFERIPEEVKSKIYKYIIINDGSSDNTLEKIQKIKELFPNLICINKKQNEGYALAQKSGFTRAMQEGADIAVLLHSDGQYSPEILQELLKPLEEERADIVQGSRMLGGRALKGGMPMYKYISNKILSFIENKAYGMNLAEYHSGYMLYSKKALEKIPFMKLSDSWHFDGEMLFMGNKKGLIIKEISIPTIYADEESHVKPIRYGFTVLGIVIKYLFGKYNF